MSFLSTPSGWRATRKESRRWRDRRKFLSTPSGWRATAGRKRNGVADRISIHALRVEGDAQGSCFVPASPVISIHALRVEGDLCKKQKRRSAHHFYPRPPGGGRPDADQDGDQSNRISIHALRVEGDYTRRSLCNTLQISIHALRVEGDPVVAEQLKTVAEFLSTPSGWRATPVQTLIVTRSLNFYPRPPGGGRQLSRLQILLGS